MGKRLIIRMDFRKIIGTVNRAGNKWGKGWCFPYTDEAPDSANFLASRKED